MYEKNNAATYKPPIQKYRYEEKVAKSPSPKSKTISKNNNINPKQIEKKKKNWFNIFN